MWKESLAQVLRISGADSLFAFLIIRKTISACLIFQDARPRRHPMNIPNEPGMLHQSSRVAKKPVHSEILQVAITCQPRPQFRDFCLAKCRERKFLAFWYSIPLLKIVRCEVIKNLAIWGCTGFFATREQSYSLVRPKSLVHSLTKKS